MGFFGLLLLIFFIWFVLMPLIRVFTTAHRAQKTFRQATSAFQQAQQGPQPRQRRAGWTRPEPRRKHIDPEVGEYVKFQERELTEEELRQRQDGSTTYTRTTYSESQIEDAEWEDI